MMNKERPVVRLRAMEPGDLDLLYKIENDTSLWEVGTTNVPYSRYALHNYIANASCDIYMDRQVRMMIENEDRVIVGIVDLVNFDPQHMRAEVGIVIEKSFRNCGYACGALRQIADYSSKVLHLHQLYVIINILNEPSLCLFRKMGYNMAGELDDWLFDGKNYQKAAVMQLFL